MIQKTPFSHRKFSLIRREIGFIHSCKIVHNATVREIEPCEFQNAKSKFYTSMRVPVNIGVIIYPDRILVSQSSHAHYQGSHGRKITIYNRATSEITTETMSYGQSNKFYKLRHGKFFVVNNIANKKLHVKVATVDSKQIIKLLKVRVAKIAVSKLVPFAVSNIERLCKDRRFNDARATIDFLDGILYNPLKYGTHYINYNGTSFSIELLFHKNMDMISKQDVMRELTFDYIDKTEKALNNALYSSVTEKLQ